MKMNDEVLRYLAGMLSEDEKKKFELQMENSPLLKEKLEKKERYLRELKALGSVEADSHYFENLMPRLRQKMASGKKKSFSFYPGLAYIIPVLAIALFFLIKPFGFNPFNRASGSSAEFAKEVSRMNDRTKVEILGSLMENESGTLQADILPENAAEAVENTMGEELYQGTDSKSQYLDTDELLNSVSGDEAESIYQNMINKKIL